MPIFLKVNIVFGVIFLLFNKLWLDVFFFCIIFYMISAYLKWYDDWKMAVQKVKINEQEIILYLLYSFVLYLFCAHIIHCVQVSFDNNK